MQCLVVLLLLLLVAGCSKRDSAVSVQSQTPKVVYPPSGGEMVLIHGGTFCMGSEQGHDDETPHQVQIDSFLMDRHPVSQELYESLTGTNPSKCKGPDNPVERVQWVEAARFCNECSAREGLTPSYDPETWECDFGADGYRLPTEAEWEYACRAGSQTVYSFGSDEGELPKHAWLKPHSKGHPQPVGRKRPNAWGLFDMHGNVWEWCNDYYSQTWYEQSPRENPQGPKTGRKRVLRGGAWSSTADSCRSSHRFSEYPVFTDACFGSDSYGFRRVRNDRPGSTSNAVAQERDTDDPAHDVAEPAGAPAETVEVTPDVEPVPATNESEVPLDGTIDPKRLTGTIVFVSDRSGALDIWRIKADGTGLKQLTSDDNADADPRFSPSGDRIMYTSLRDGFPHIFTMNSDGSNSHIVAEGSQPAWSPNGKSIIFIRDDQAYVRELASGDERRVTPADWRRCGVPAWSPDGEQVAVASRHLERIGIFVMDLSGAEPKQLETEDACCSPQWSPDGSTMTFQTDKGHIHLFYVDDEVEEQVTFGADIQHDARYSPDGSMIAYCRAPSEEGPWQIWITDLASDDLESIHITSKGSNRLPDWHRIEF